MKQEAMHNLPDQHGCPIPPSCKLRDKTAFSDLFSLSFDEIRLHWPNLDLIRQREIFPDMHRLSAYFIDPSYSRHEIAYRLPASVPIYEFWPEELRFRRSRSVTLPLRTVNSKSFWYVPVGSLLLYENLSFAAQAEKPMTCHLPMRTASWMRPILPVQLRVHPVQGKKRIR